MKLEQMSKDQLIELVEELEEQKDELLQQVHDLEDEVANLAEQVADASWPEPGSFMSHHEMGH